MDISVFGIGYVGAVSAACLVADGHSVTAVDTNQQKVKAFGKGQSPIVEPGLDDLIAKGASSGRLRATVDSEEAVRASDASFICVGTPSLANGNLDLNYVVRVCEDIGLAIKNKDRFHCVIVRSTMLPGSMRNVVIPVLEKFSGKKAGKDFGIAIYPEFLREGTAIKDYYEIGTIVFGAEDPKSESILREINANLSGKVYVTDLSTAEAIKYANNAWHATKIVFSNEIGNLCSRLGIDSHKVMDIVCTDTRLNISRAYMRPGFAYGGSCLPKDLRALGHKAKSVDLRLPLLESLAESNSLQIQHALDMVVAAGNRKVGMIGLSFKSATDDMRESPAVELAERLFGKGYDLRVFDHNVVHSKLTGSNLAFIQTHIPHLSDLLTDDLESVARHGDTLIIVNGDVGGRTFPKLRSDQAIIDLYRAPAAEKAGGRYRGLCW
jgi:GDP-mannose 6-dehydrogenase